MIIESVIISANIILSLIYKKRIELLDYEKRIMKYFILIFQILLFFINLYFIFALFLLIIYIFKYKSKFLVILNLIVNNFLCILIKNPFAIVLLLIYNPLILWSEL